MTAEPELASVTTKTGDAGTSTLMFGALPKDDPVFEFLGTVDELNSLLGVCNVYLSSEHQPKVLAIQHKLFDLSACIACNKKPSDALVEFVHVLERWSLELEKTVPQFQFFILPGGCQSASYVHLARTVARRSERSLVHAMNARKDIVDGETAQKLIPVLNRLSDFLFLLARYENVSRGVPEVRYESTQ